MTLQASGAISLAQVNTELGLAAAATRSLGDSNVRALAGVASGIISLSNLYGKSNAPVITPKGYFGGGFEYSGMGSTITSPSSATIMVETFSLTNKLDCLTFATESAANIAFTLTVPRFNLAGVNSSTRGYFGGGSNGFYLQTEIDGSDFATDASINPAATLSLGRSHLAGVNSSTRGYFAGGMIVNSPYMTNEIDGLVFSSESAINPAATLAVVRYWLTGVSSSTRGYFGGGSVRPEFSGISNTAEIDGIDFGTEAAINPTASLVSPRAWLTGVNSSTRGYFAGGGHDMNYNPLTEIDGIVFATETTINPAAALTIARHELAGVNSSTRGYFAGGNITTARTYAVSSNEIDGIQFDTEAAINPAATLIEKRIKLAGFQSGSL
jgi:hypothetical protein